MPNKRSLNFKIDLMESRYLSIRRKILLRRTITAEFFTDFDLPKTYHTTLFRRIAKTIVEDNFLFSKVCKRSLYTKYIILSTNI
jgi:hypothetical protein